MQFTADTMFPGDLFEAASRFAADSLAAGDRHDACIGRAPTLLHGCVISRYEDRAVEMEAAMGGFINDGGRTWCQPHD